MDEPGATTQDLVANRPDQLREDRYILYIGTRLKDNAQTGMAAVVSFRDALSDCAPEFFHRDRLTVVALVRTLDGCRDSSTSFWLPWQLR
jgi:hypothetical protein